MEALNFEDVKGVFLIMTSGIMLSWLWAGWSFLWNIRNLAIEYNVIIYLSIRIPYISYEIIFIVSYKLCFILQVSYKNQMIEELKFLAKCSNKKIIKRRKTSLETIGSNSTDS